jgi:HSP20 family protein
MHRFIKIRIVRDLDHLQERVRGFMDTLLESKPTTPSFRPAVDFYETAQGLTLRLELAGVPAEDVAISLAGQELVIRGCRKPPPPHGIRRFIRLEMGFGDFERSFVLPIPIDPQGVQARYADGVLEIQLPRKIPLNRSIPVKTPSETEETEMEN